MWICIAIGFSFSILCCTIGTITMQEQMEREQHTRLEQVQHELQMEYEMNTK